MFDLKPKIKVMTREQIDKVHHDALSILREAGVIVHDPGARGVFEEAIGKHHEDGRVRLPEDLVQWAITTAPSDIQIYDRLGAPCFELKGNGSQDTVFGIGCTNLHYENPFDSTIKPFHREHMSAAAG
ncbi:MAG: hypothetical protein GY809_10785, partial [Planctomycetes bacterium]|nr:hypothetical protein [Planctomycetota bacterium]